MDKFCSHNCRDNYREERIAGITLNANAHIDGRCIYCDRALFNYVPGPTRDSIRLFNPSGFGYGGDVGSG